MAKLQEEIIVIKVSRLIKDTDNEVSKILTADAKDNLEAVVQELVGDKVLVETVTE